MIASDTRRRLVAIISIGVALLIGCGAALAVTGGSGHDSAPAAFPGSRTAIHARTVTFPASDGTTVTGADPAPPSSAPAPFPGSEAASGSPTTTVPASDGTTVTGADPAPPSSAPAARSR